MNTDSNIDGPIADLQRRKIEGRERIKKMSPAEKIRQLEALQERYYELLEIRAANGGKAIPENWNRWKKAQQTK